MNPEIDFKLEQLRRKARLEYLVRPRDDARLTWTDFETHTRRLFKLQCFGVRLEIRKLVRT
jgi:hypothetical protein